MQLLLPPYISLFLLIFLFFPASKAYNCVRYLNENSQLKIASTITVDKSGAGNFVTIQAAINSVPSGNNQWIRIHVNPGIYMEKVTINQDKPCIYLEGSGQSQTTIVWNGHFTTGTSATFTVLPGNFVAKGITFKNSYNHALKMINGGDYARARTRTRARARARAPAVAAKIHGDKCAFHQCAFVGFQDTLWDVQGRHYFNSCYIEGAVDFIWGSGQSFYEDCSINVTAALLPSHVSAGYITAQGRNSAYDPSGFVFTRGSVYGGGHVYLGRAYRPYSRVMFYGTSLAGVVVQEGWNAWVYQGHEQNFFYAEISCHGLGADTSKRVHWVNVKIEAEELAKFSRSNFIDQDGWLYNHP